MLENIGEAELREICRTRLENAERWLRRLVHDELSKIALEYLSAVRPDGSRLVKGSISLNALARRSGNLARYPREVDALLLDELIAIICNPGLYDYFRPALKRAYPNGVEEARFFLERLIAPRNFLAHANQITLRQAEQIVCYSGDVVDSLKSYYKYIEMENEYNVPMILRFSDSLGNVYERNQMSPVHDGGVGVFLHERTMLRPGETLAVELEIDPSFDQSEYDIRWESRKRMDADNFRKNRIVISISDALVGREWNLHCLVVSKKSWHRLQMGCDDFLMVTYRILPPI